MSFISVRGSGGPNSVAVKENAPKLRPLLFRKSSIEFDRFRNCATLSKATQAEKEVPTGPHMRTRSTRPTPYNPVSRGPGLRCTVYSQHQAPSIPGLRCTVYSQHQTPSIPFSSGPSSTLPCHSWQDKLTLESRWNQASKDMLTHYVVLSTNYIEIIRR